MCATGELRAGGGDVAEPCVGVGAAAREQPQEVRLARPVGSEHRDPVAEPDLEVERLHEPGELEALGDDGALPVRPPRSRSVRSCSGGRSSGGPASSNFASRVWAAR